MTPRNNQASRYVNEKGGREGGKVDRGNGLPAKFATLLYTDIYNTFDYWY